MLFMKTYILQTYFLDYQIGRLSRLFKTLHLLLVLYHCNCFCFLFLNGRPFGAGKFAVVT